MLDWRTPSTGLGDEEVMGEPSDWSQPKARLQEGDLGCPPTLNPQAQEFLTEGETPWAGDGPEDDPQWTSMPEPFPQKNNEWVHWHAQHVEMPMWWQELQEVPSQSDIKEFTQRVCVSLQVPKAKCHASKVENDYSVLPAPQSLDRDQFLPIQDMRFSSQDYQMMQPQKTLAYAKALQH